MVKKHIIYNDYSDWRFDLKKAKSSYIWTGSGDQLIDFTSGWNVTNLGWNHPEVNRALSKYAKKNTYVPMWAADAMQTALAQALVKSLPRGLDAVGRATGGTEANEMAIKTARAYTKRKKILGFKDSYHGQSYATMSLGYRPEYVKNISPMVGSFVQIDYPSAVLTDQTEEEILAKFEKKLDKLLSSREYAAVVTEAGIITGWGATLIAPKGFLKVVRKITKRYGTLLILDEVGTGFSRCGKLYGMNLEHVTPDIVTFAKGLSNGAAAIGAMVTSSKIANQTYKSSNLTSTFGWTPAACAAALKTLELHQQYKLWEKAAIDGKHVLSVLREELAKNPLIKSIHGLGLEIGVTFAKDKIYEKVAIKARVNGLHIVCGDDNNIQIMPPLTIKRKTLDRGIEILVETIKSFL